MKICFVAINAKYIHTSPAVRILNKIVNSKNKITLTKLDENNKQLYSWIIDASCYKKI